MVPKPTVCQTSEVTKTGRNQPGSCMNEIALPPNPSTIWLIVPLSAVSSKTIPATTTIDMKCGR